MKRVFSCWVVGVFVFAGVAEAQTVLYRHTFDGVDNDSTPAIQAMDNGVRNPMVTLATGEIKNRDSDGSGFVSTAAGGFNTTAGIDLSALEEFTVEFVVANNFSGTFDTCCNGSFFGIVNSPTPNATDGTALYNNAGNDNPLGTSLGVTLGNIRAYGPSIVWDAFSVNFANFTPVFVPMVEVLDDATDGYTIFVSYANDEATNYAALAANVTPNVSSQGGNISVESITIMDGPAVCPPTLLLGDVNQDSVVNFLDIGPFVTVLSTSDYQFEADITGEGVVNFLDIPPFITILSGN